MKLFVRVKNLLLKPSAEWDVIAREEDEPKRLAVRFVAPLVALPTIATVIGLCVIGVEVDGRRLRAPWGDVLTSAFVFYVMAVAGVFVFAHVLTLLAPRFGARPSYPQAFKLAAYSTTAAMLAGVLTLIPALGVLAMLGASYSLYLLFIGAPKLMAAPARSAINLSIVATGAALLFALAAGLASMATASPAGTLFLPISSLPDLAGVGVKVEDAADETRDLPPSAGQLRPEAPARAQDGELRSAAPKKLFGLDRVSVGTERRGLPGARTVELDAEYRSGRRYIRLQILYSKSLAERIGFGGPATSEYDRETAEGYARRRRIGEAIIVEEWNEASGVGSYARLVADRFYVKASGGNGVRPADLRQVVELFGQETLARFAAAS